MFRLEAGVPDFLAFQNISQSLMQGYSSDVQNLDVLLKEELRRPHDFIGRAVTEQNIIGERVWQASEIYQELARPNGTHHVLSMNLSTDVTDCAPFLTFFRPAGSPSLRIPMMPPGYSNPHPRIVLI